MTVISEDRKVKNNTKKGTQFQNEFLCDNEKFSGNAYFYEITVDLVRRVYGRKMCENKIVIFLSFP